MTVIVGRETQKDTGGHRFFVSEPTFTFENRPISKKSSVFKSNVTQCAPPCWIVEKDMEVNRDDPSGSQSPRGSIHQTLIVHCRLYYEK